MGRTQCYKESKHTCKLLLGKQDQHTDIRRLRIKSPSNFYACVELPWFEVIGAPPTRRQEGQSVKHLGTDQLQMSGVWEAKRYCVSSKTWPELQITYNPEHGTPPKSGAGRRVVCRDHLLSSAIRYSVHSGPNTSSRYSFRYPCGLSTRTQKCTSAQTALGP